MRTQLTLLVTLCLAVAGCSAPVSSSPSRSVLPGASSTSSGQSSDPLHSLLLRDVRTGATFTLGELAAERAVLLETMAIWCTNCRGQQRQVVDAHALTDFESVSLDVDPNERAADLADYADREGFDWHFAVADGDLARMLRERFGTAVLNPPSMPKILLRTDGSVELIGLGQQLGASELAAILGG
ncbi:MAG: hypothetical protein ABI978_05015 [Chloroflexota bacterium]